MRNISQDFRREYIKGNRNYDITINLTLADGETEITLTNEDIWQGGFSFEESISDSNSFDIGDAIIGKCTIILDNIDERFSRYDFFNATMWVYIGLHGLDEQPIRIGYYTVDETSYNGSLITLNCLDNLWRFDIPFSNITLTYPCTIRDIIEEMCEYSGIGITLATQTFHNYNFTINTAPDGDFNCREVLQYLAQICCCYCTINSQGNLELRWIDKTDITGISNYDGGTFNTTTTPYSDGDSLDGGDFTDYSSGDTADGGLFYNSQDTFGYIVHNSQMQVGTDDIWITGVRVCSNDTNSENGYDVLWVDAALEQTHERYVLVIQENPFINANNANVIATDIGSILAGTPIRSFNSTSLSDISIEVGDPCQINDFRGNAFYTWVTNIKFVSDGYESFSCGAESIMSNKTVRYSDTVKTLVEAKRNAQEIVSVYDQAVKNMNDLAQEALGYHEYKYTVLGADIMWRYSGEDIDTTDPSHPLFEDSDTVFKISADGVFISTDGGVTYTNGYDANSGTAILNLIYAHGIKCDWIKSGQLTLGGEDNTDGLCSVQNALGVEKVRLDNEGLHAVAGYIAGMEITNNSIGARGNNMAGIFLSPYNFSISVPRGSSYSTLEFADNSTSRSWGAGRCTLWTGGEGDGGFHVSNSACGEPGALRGFTAMKHNKFEIWSSGNKVATFDQERYEVWNSYSDSRLKKNVKSVDTCTSRNFLSALKPITFKYNSKLSLKSDVVHSGFIAQDVLNNEFSTSGIVEKSGGGYYTLHYNEIIPHLVNVVNSQSEEIDLLKKEIKILKERMDSYGNTSS